jgi:hypothetical protein
VGAAQPRDQTSLLIPVILPSQSRNIKSILLHHEDTSSQILPIV